MDACVADIPKILENFLVSGYVQILTREPYDVTHWQLDALRLWAAQAKRDGSPPLRASLRRFRPRLPLKTRYVFPVMKAQRPSRTKAPANERPLTSPAHGRRLETTPHEFSATTKRAFVCGQPRREGAAERPPWSRSRYTPPRNYTDHLLRTRDLLRTGAVNWPTHGTLRLGCRLDVVDRRGRPRRLDCGWLRYLGPTSFGAQRKTWCGIELDLPLGKHAGMVDGVQYFRCEPNHGLFVPIELCRKCRDLDEKSSSAPTEEVAREESNSDARDLSPANLQESMRAQAKFEQYFRMVDVGVPKSAVALKMIADGIDKADADAFEGKSTEPVAHNAKKSDETLKQPELFRQLHWEANGQEDMDWPIDAQDMTQLKASFGKATRSNTSPVERTGHKKRRPCGGGAAAPVLDGRRAMNVSIMLGKLVGSGNSLLPSYRALAEALCLRTRKLTAEQLELLSAVAPTPEERDALRSRLTASGEYEDVSPAEAALAELSAVPRCLAVVRAELLATTYESRISTVLEEATARCFECLAVIESRSLRRFLAAVSAIASVMREPRGAPQRVALGSMLSLMRAKGTDGRSFAEVVVGVLSERGDFEALDFAHGPLGRLTSTRGEPRELALTVAAISKNLEQAKVLVEEELRDEAAADAHNAARAVENARRCEAERAELAKKARTQAEARERAHMTTHDISWDQERNAILGDRAKADAAVAFASLALLRSAIREATLKPIGKSPQSPPVTPPKIATPIEDRPRRSPSVVDPSAWARKRKNALEKAAAIRAVRAGTALPEDICSPRTPERCGDPINQRTPNNNRRSRRGLPDRLAACLDAGNVSPPVLRAAAAWARWLVDVPPAKLPSFWTNVETFTERAMHALASRMAWRKATRLASDAPRVVTTTAIENPEQPKLQHDKAQKTTSAQGAVEGRRALLAAIGGSASTILMKKKRPAPLTSNTGKIILRHTTVGAMAARARSFSRDVASVDGALDAAHAALSAARAHGDECRRFLAAGALSTDAALATVAELARIVAHTVDRCALVPSRRSLQEPRCGNKCVTPWGVGTVQAFRHDPQSDRLVVLVAMPFAKAYLQPSAIAHPPCCVLTPYGPGIAQARTHDDPHWTVKFTWGIAAVATRDIKWLSQPHHQHHHRDSDTAESPIEAQHFVKSEDADLTKISDEVTNASVLVAPGVFANDRSSVSSDSGSLNSDIDDDDLANLGSFLEI